MIRSRMRYLAELPETRFWGVGQWRAAIGTGRYLGSGGSGR
jgi:hypothetical protein